jgi:sortase A
MTDPAPPRPPVAAQMGPLRRWVRELGLGLITLGVIVLLFVAYELLGTNLAESHSQSNLKRSFASAQASTKSGSDTPTINPGADLASSDLPPGGAIDHLVIPKIGVDKYVVQGIGEEDLRRGPGHYPETVMPGQLGNAAIAGHRTTYGAPFFDLDHLKAGDDIFLTDTQNRRWDYKVTRSFVVSPSDVSVLNPTPFAQLTLTTCTPRFSAASRLIVTAQLFGQVPLPAPSPTATVQSAPQLIADKTLGHGNSNAWTPAILYGLLVVGLWTVARLAINRTRRWGRLAAYAVGIGVCLVPLWFCFENVSLLLPQNI